MPQMLQIDWMGISSYLLANNLQNVVFYDSNGTILPAWCESSCSASSTSSVVWVNLGSDAIAGNGGTMDLNIGFYPTSHNNFDPNGNWGEYPTATAKYGQYDNGKRVFSFYDNFAGSALESSWSVFRSNVQVSNGLKISSSQAEWSGLQNDYSSSHYQVVDALLNSGTPDLETGKGIALEKGIGQSGYCYTSTYLCFELRDDNNTPAYRIESNSGNTGDSGSYSPNTNYILSGYSGEHQQLSVNYSLITSNPHAVSGNLSPTIAVYNSSLFVQWIRVRVAPPNNVMPRFSGFALLYQNDPPFTSGDGEDYYGCLTYQSEILGIPCPIGVPSSIDSAWEHLLDNVTTPPTDFVSKFSWDTFKIAFTFQNLNTSNSAVHPLNYTLMDSVIKTLHNYGFKVIIADYDWSGFGSSTWVKDWIGVTDHYKGDQDIEAFDLFNEPQSTTWSANVTTYQYNSTEGVESAFSNVTVAIHKIDPSRYVYWYAPYIQNEIYPPFRQPNVLFDFHLYANEPLKNSLDSILNTLYLANSQNSSIACLEFNAEGSKGVNFTLSDAQISMLESHNVPFITWLYTSYPQDWITILDNASGISNSSSTTTSVSSSSSSTIWSSTYGSSTTTQKTTSTKSTSYSSSSTTDSSTSSKTSSSTTSFSNLTSDSSSLSSISSSSVGYSSSTDNDSSSSNGSSTASQLVSSSSDGSLSSSSEHGVNLISSATMWKSGEQATGFLGLDQQKFTAATYGASTSVSIIVLGTFIIIVKMTKKQKS
jgi:hypothetical protein